MHSLTFRFIARQFAWIQNRKSLQAASEEKKAKEVRDCTFRPEIGNKSSKTIGRRGTR